MEFSSTIKLSLVKPRNGYFFDYSALKRRKATKEEYVRTGIVKALQSVYGYLPIQISTEAPLWWRKHYRYRADVILWEDTDRTRPLAVIETKAPATGLTSNMLQKLQDCARCLEPGPQLLVLTNGRNTSILHLKTQHELSRFPTLQESIKGFQGISPLPPPKPYRRPLKTPFEVGPTEVRHRLRSFPNLSISDKVVPLNAKRAYLGLYELLMDESINLAAYRPSWMGFTLLEDRFVRWSDFGNASGGRFYCKYRCLLLETPNGAQRDFYISVSRYAKSRNDPVSSLAVIGGVDGKQALQLQSDVEACSYSPVEATLCHRGYISLGEGGRIATKETLSAIGRELPNLLEKGKIIAARISADSLRGAAARQSILRLAALSDILDRVRTKIRMQRAT